LTPATHPDLLVGTETGDDAAVWRLDADRALVATADFITPLVDDPYTWGRIAAANSVSDVYAMGGRPLFALNLVAWNSDELSPAELTELLSGAGNIADECGYLTIGGHTIDDPVPKFGLVVLGEVHPDRLLRNAALRDGDALVLTKPLGTGVVATAIKSALAPDDVTAAAIASMCATNAKASEAALSAGATGGTDVTGFGLLGHLGQMAQASGVDAVINVQDVPMLPGARELVDKGIVSGGTKRNLEWIRDRVDFDGITEASALLLADAQTSGGLLFGANPDRARVAVKELQAAEVPATVIGHVQRGPGRVLVR
jgi:selenide,water dikinase